MSKGWRGDRTSQLAVHLWGHKSIGEGRGVRAEFRPDKGVQVLACGCVRLVALLISGAGSGLLLLLSLDAVAAPLKADIQKAGDTAWQSCLLVLNYCFRTRPFTRLMMSGAPLGLAIVRAVAAVGVAISIGSPWILYSGVRPFSQDFH